MSNCILKTDGGVSTILCFALKKYCQTHLNKHLANGKQNFYKDTIYTIKSHFKNLVIIFIWLKHMLPWLLPGNAKVENLLSSDVIHQWKPKTMYRDHNLLVKLFQHISSLGPVYDWDIWCEQQYSLHTIQKRNPVQLHTGAHIKLSYFVLSQTKHYKTEFTLSVDYTFFMSIKRTVKYLNVLFSRAHIMCSQN